MIGLGLAVISGLFALICLGCVGLCMKLATEVWKVRELTNGGLKSGQKKQDSDIVFQNLALEPDGRVRIKPEFGSKGHNRDGLWEPWALYAWVPEGSRLPITEPPCSRCRHFQPRKERDGVSICRKGETSNQCGDFSCFELARG